MAVALKNNCRDMEINTNRLITLENILLDRLVSAAIDFKRNGSYEHVPGTLSLSFKNTSGEMILHRLDLMGICVSTGSACNSKSTELSHVLLALNLEETFSEGTIRISMGKNNTIEEAQQISDALIKILSMQ
jgi:cysteine desulfurase